MTFFPHEHDSKCYRRRTAALFVDILDNLVSAEALRKAYLEPPDRGSGWKEVFPLRRGASADRKAEVDQTAAGMGATTEWLNGCYIARLGALELHFDPPILLADLGGASEAKAA
jgi:hypothetical protein